MGVSRCEVFQTSQRRFRSGKGVQPPAALSFAYFRSDSSACLCRYFRQGATDRSGYSVPLFPAGVPRYGRHAIVFGPEPVYRGAYLHGKPELGLGLSDALFLESVVPTLVQLFRITAP
jgi:hypothetical protein